MEEMSHESRESSLLGDLSTQTFVEVENKDCVGATEGEIMASILPRPASGGEKKRTVGAPKNVIKKGGGGGGSGASRRDPAGLNCLLGPS